MTMIDIEDLKRWRANRIQSGCCSFDDMQALGHFIDQVEKREQITCGECKYRYLDNHVWVCPFGLMIKGADGYCNYGERNDEQMDRCGVATRQSIQNEL